jgi:hypothetical protein
MSQSPQCYVCIAPILFLVACAVVPSSGATLTLTPSDFGTIRNPADLNDARVLLRFEMPSELVAGKTELAVLELQASITSPDTLGGLDIRAELVETEWDGDTVEWAHGWNTPGGDVVRQLRAVWTAPLGQASVLRFDITDMVREWATAQRENWGVMLFRAPGERGTFATENGDAMGVSGPTATVWYTPLREQ